MESFSPTNILDLSNELIYRICRHLSFNDLVHLLLTCRQIYGILISDICLWKQSKYELSLSNDLNKNIVRINSLMLSPLISFCTRLYVRKLINEENGVCIPTIFFRYFLSALSHQLKELSLIHVFDGFCDEDDDSDKEEGEEEEEYEDDISICSRYL